MLLERKPSCHEQEGRIRLRLEVQEACTTGCVGERACCAARQTEAVALRCADRKARGRRRCRRVNASRTTRGIVALTRDRDHRRRAFGSVRGALDRSAVTDHAGSGERTCARGRRCHATDTRYCECRRSDQSCCHCKDELLHDYYLTSVGDRKREPPRLP